MMAELATRLSELLERSADLPKRSSFREQDLPGYPAQSTRGPYQHIRCPVRDFCPDYDRLPPQSLDGAGRLLAQAIGHEHFAREIGPLVQGYPQRTVFLDLETCGFSGSPLFLIGLIHQHSDALVLDQFFARDYREEPSVLAALLEYLGEASILVTFNGKSFDWPFVRDRLARHRLDRPDNPPHLDLLHTARRLFKGSLPNYRLQTLEASLCGRRRVGDLAGRQVAQAYHEYVRTGALRQIRQILRHNALDVLTMVQMTELLVKSEV